ncbi:uncharacterized protein J4E87_008639 [Alternaria ethzedia]|uniref:uncharacterized protein n=1 Tax=Alternaria ethzedia TaxID=181014 RepID=UPI0020C25A22|nr:uncharacterized protein J4E87_008639 [Alternaria ethzedia]KAI4616373.1 hypothetical protein J4E87_008639 [Alternaria ethzedia]
MPSMVVIPANGHERRRVLVDRDEQYLVQWTSETTTTKPPLSWHSVKDLVRCLEQIQDYLEVREK